MASVRLEALDAAEEVSVHGTGVRIPRVEDLVLYKIVGWRPQDQQDIERLVGLHAKTMNLERVMRLTRELSEALEDPERLAEVEQLMSRVLKRPSLKLDEAVPAQESGNDKAAKAECHEKRYRKPEEAMRSTLLGDSDDSPESVRCSWPAQRADVLQAPRASRAARQGRYARRRGLSAPLAC